MSVYESFRIMTKKMNSLFFFLYKMLWDVFSLHCTQRPMSHYNYTYISTSVQICLAFLKVDIPSFFWKSIKVLWDHFYLPLCRGTCILTLWKIFLYLISRKVWNEESFFAPFDIATQRVTLHHQLQNDLLVLIYEILSYLSKGTIISATFFLFFIIFSLWTSNLTNNTESIAVFNYVGCQRILLHEHWSQFCYYKQDSLNFWNTILFETIQN